MIRDDLVARQVPDWFPSIVFRREAVPTDAIQHIANAGGRVIFIIASSVIDDLVDHVLAFRRLFWLMLLW